MEHCGIRDCVSGVFWGLLLLCPLISTGCKKPAEPLPAARSGWVKWTDDLVVVVADGRLPEPLAGFYCGPTEPTGTSRIRNVRFASTEQTLAMLRTWNSAGRLHLAIIPSPEDDFPQIDSDFFGVDLMPEEWLAIAEMMANSSKAPGEFFVFVIASESDYAEVYRLLQTEGLADEFPILLDRILECLQTSQTPSGSRK